MKMFLIKRKSKNSSVSAALISTSSSPSLAPLPNKTNTTTNTTTSLQRFSRSNQHQPTLTNTTNTNTTTVTPSPPPQDLSGYQSNPEDHQSMTHSFSQQSRFPTVVSPDGTQSQVTRFGIRKSRQIPAFKLMVLGAKMSGKSTFLHTLLSTLTPSVPSSPDPLPPIPMVPTPSLSEKQISISTLSGEKVMLSVIDTPGLDIHSQDQFRVDLQVNEALRYIESKFDDSLYIERQVHRNPTKLGDVHVHLVIYFIDPSTILRQRQPATSAKRTSDSAPPNNGLHELHMSAIDLRQLKRLSCRCNILPVIGRSDELTGAELTSLKHIVRSDMKAYGIDLGVFNAREAESDSNDDESLKPPETAAETAEAKDGSGEATTEAAHSGKTTTEDEGPKKLPRRKSTALIAPRRPFSYVMDSLQEFESVCGMIPLSVIGAEVIPAQSMDADQMDRLNQVNPLFTLPSNLPSPSIFVRRFRWATVDVLNSHHCDFVLLRAVVLGSHFKRLKEATRLEKYEKYRTEKLLARRLTLDKGPIGLEEQKRIAIEIERMQIPHIEPTVSIFVSPATSSVNAAAQGKTSRVSSHSKTGFKTASSWRNKFGSPTTYESQPNLYQPTHVNPSPENYRQSHHPPPHHHPENVNNNVPMVF